MSTERQLAHRLHSQQGLSLIEIMVALTISAFLMAGVIQVFISNKYTYNVQSAMSRLQENGRFVLQLMGEDIRIGDFWGCRGQASKVINNLNAGAGYIDFTNNAAISGTDNSGLNGSDSITISGALAAGLNAQTPFMSQTSSLIKVANNKLQQGDILLISDCKSGDIFQITNSNANNTGQLIHNTDNSVSPGNKSNDLSRKYNGQSTIYAVRQHTYSIQSKTVRGKAVPGLYRSDNGTAAVELVEGVESMQILYGEDTNGNGTANRYLSAGTAGLNMSRVISVRIDITLVTLANNLSTNNNGSDRRIRQNFSTTTTIRNRLI